MHSKRQILHFTEKSSKTAPWIITNEPIFNDIDIRFCVLERVDKGGLMAAERRERGKTFSLRGK
jgi:hypothetical protein